jgi:hypothetical protein
MRKNALGAAAAVTALSLFASSAALPVLAAPAPLLRPVPSPNQPPGPNVLTSVWSSSAGDAWAVGTWQSASGGPTATLAEHWNGRRWALVTIPNPVPGPNVLMGVSGSGPADVWAVGYRFDAGGTGKTLTEHWNGSKWAVVPSPNVGGSGFLFAVSVLGPNNAFAVGFFDNSPKHFPQTLIEHWDGSTWTVQSSPNTTSSVNLFSGVVALSKADAWAVGYGEDAESGFQEVLAAHYDGVAWRPVATQNPGYKALTAVSATASKDVWAVGAQFGAASARADGLVEHWNGTAWSVIPTPDRDATMMAVAARAPGDAWAVGFSQATLGSRRASVAEHWDGAMWTSVHTAGFGTTDNALYGAAETSGGLLWAVGTRADSTGLNLTLIANNCPMCA